MSARSAPPPQGPSARKGPGQAGGPARSAPAGCVVLGSRLCGGAWRRASLAAVPVGCPRPVVMWWVPTSKMSAAAPAPARCWQPSSARGGERCVQRLSTSGGCWLIDGSFGRREVISQLHSGCFSSLRGLCGVPAVKNRAAVEAVNDAELLAVSTSHSL